MIEAESPGSKFSFYHLFLDRMSPFLENASAGDRGELQRCERCGAPSTNDVCAFCLLTARAGAIQPVPVELVVKRYVRKATIAPAHQPSRGRGAERSVATMAVADTVPDDMHDQQIAP
jgi:hypothetical protein